MIPETISDTEINNAITEIDACFDGISRQWAELLLLAAEDPDRALPLMDRAREHEQRLMSARQELAAESHLRLTRRIIRGGLPALAEARRELNRCAPPGSPARKVISWEVITPAAQYLRRHPDGGTVALTSTRSRAPRQHRSTGGSTSTQDPGDPDPDSDPVQRRVQELVSLAPPLSSAQRQLLGRLLGGGVR